MEIRNEEMEKRGIALSSVTTRLPGLTREHYAHAVVACAYARDVFFSLLSQDFGRCLRDGALEGSGNQSQRPKNRGYFSSFWSDHRLPTPLQTVSIR